MPVLHKYKDKEGYYILTSIKGNIITFHLTPDGHNKILKAGLTTEQPFPRALLLDLYRSGEVFTQGTGPGEIIDARQTELDFSNDPDPEKLFPSCAACDSINDLHLIEIKEGGHKASILCVACRFKKIAAFDTSIPLTLVSRTILNQVIAMKGLTKIDASVKTYKKLLDAEFESKWNTYRKEKAEQGVLIEVDTGTQGKLI